MFVVLLAFILSDELQLPNLLAEGAIVAIGNLAAIQILCVVRAVRRDWCAGGN